MSQPFIIPNVGAWASKAEFEAEQARIAPRVQRRDYQGFVTTGGLHHDPRAPQWRQPLNQRANCPLIIGQRKLLAAGPQRHF